MAIKGIGFDYLGVTAPDLDEQPDPQILGLVDHLREQGYKVGLLSNLSAGWAEAFYAAKVDTHFDTVHLSGETGIAKPDPRAFTGLADALGVATSELVFIDDRAESMIGIESLGITPILYENYEQLISQLAKLDVVPLSTKPAGPA